MAEERHQHFVATGLKGSSRLNLSSLIILSTSITPSRTTPRPIRADPLERPSRPALVLPTHSRRLLCSTTASIHNPTVSEVSTSLLRPRLGVGNSALTRSLCDYNRKRRSTRVRGEPSLSPFANPFTDPSLGVGQAPRDGHRFRGVIHLTFLACRM